MNSSGNKLNVIKTRSDATLWLFLIFLFILKSSSSIHSLEPSKSLVLFPLIDFLNIDRLDSLFPRHTSH